MPQDQPGFKGLVISYLKANTEILNIPEEFKLFTYTHDPEKGKWVAMLDIMGDSRYRGIHIDSEDLLGFMWNKITLMAENQ